MRELSYLAFAAGYRRVSFVLIENDQLATWHTSRNAAKTPEEAAHFARDFIDLLEPHIVVMEDVEAGTRKGATALAALDAIAKEARQSRARLVTLKRERLFRTRHAEACHLAQHYPDLADKVAERRYHDHEPYHSVLFEALALADQAKRGSALLLAQKM
jgi:hypothetical protein